LCADGKGGVSFDDLPDIAWHMPSSLDTLFGAAQLFADEVAALTGGRFPSAGGEVVPALEVLPAVASGEYPIGHSTTYYYLDLSEAAAFGTSLPFGLTTRQQNGCLYEGGGLGLLQGVYENRFGVIQFPAGNTGGQMGGWFNRRSARSPTWRACGCGSPGWAHGCCHGSGSRCSRSPARRSTRHSGAARSTLPSGLHPTTTSTSACPR
jgi:hypothetical protein